MSKNIYMRLPDHLTESVDPDFADTGFVRSVWLPYQQKIEYEAVCDSSELDKDESASTNEDEKCMQEQPYETPTSIHFGKNLKHIATNEMARRSDIVITSTISLNLICKDKRLIKEKYLGLMSRKEMVQYIDEKNAFKAMLKEHAY